MKKGMFHSEYLVLMFALLVVAIGLLILYSYISGALGG